MDVGGRPGRPRRRRGRSRSRVWAELTAAAGLRQPGRVRRRRPTPAATACTRCGHCKSARLLVTRDGADSRWLGGAGGLAGEDVGGRRLEPRSCRDRSGGSCGPWSWATAPASTRETSEAFRVAGTYHVLALSGAQVALLARRSWPGPAVRPAARRASRCASSRAPSRATRRSWAATSPWCGPRSWRWRCSCGRFLDLEGEAANLLGLAARGATRPRAVRPRRRRLPALVRGHAGTHPAHAPPSPRRKHLPFRLEYALAASLAAQAALVPLLAVHFHRLAPAALLLNLVAVPLSARRAPQRASPCSRCSLVLPALAPWAGDVAWICAHALLRSGDLVRHAAGPRRAGGHAGSRGRARLPVRPASCWPARPPAARAVLAAVLGLALRRPGTAARRRGTAACT